MGGKMPGEQEPVRLNQWAEQRRELDRSINIHVEADPDDDGIRELSETVCETVRAEESPVIQLEDLVDWPEVPRGASILIEMPEEAWEEPENYFEEWTELTKILRTARAREFYAVVVSEDIPKAMQATMDLRTRVEDGSPQWFEVELNAYGGEFYERKLTEW